MQKWEANMLLTNVIAGFREIGDSISSPARTVTKIVKVHTNGCYPIPVAYLELECGHSAKAIMHKPYERAHDDANHIAQPGAVLGCTDCRRYNKNLAKLRALRPGDVQHARFRTRDSRGVGKGDYYVYRRDTKSPTGVTLLMSIEATHEADELLRALQASPLSPTEAR